MNADQVYLYKDRIRGEEVSRADVCLDGFWLYGLRLPDGEASRCEALPLPAADGTDALCARLEDSRALWDICAALRRRLSAFLREKELALFWGRVEVQPRAAAGQGVWLLFHKGAASRFADKRDYLCNCVLPDGAEICGIRLEWISEKALTVAFPAPDDLRRRDALLRDPAAMAAICARIRAAAAPAVAGKPAPSPSRAVVSGKPCNRYGRIKNAAAASLLKYTPGNVLRPAGMVEVLTRGWGKYTPPKPDSAACANALGSGYIDTPDIELLDALGEFRFLTNAMLLDLFACGRIPSDGRFIGTARLNKLLDKLTGLGLVTPCRFISTDGAGKPVPGMNSIAKIYVLSALGGTLLRELGREARTSAFDAYQDGAVVREILSINQWLLYWLAAFPEAVSGPVVRDRIVYGLGTELSGAWLGAWLTVGGRMLVALPLRRCAALQADAQAANQEEKAARLARLLEAPDRLYSFSGDEYQSMKLAQPPILCWICEDEAHMLETAPRLAPLAHAGQTVWLSCDQRLFNYEFEGQRFRPLSADGLGDWLDPGVFLGVGEERKEEKRLDREDPAAAADADETEEDVL